MRNKINVRQAIYQLPNATRVMNAIVQKAEARRRQKAAAEAVKIKAVTREVSHEEVPIVTIAEASDDPQLTTLKRKASDTPRATGQSTSSGEVRQILTEARPLRQMRSGDHSRVNRCRSNLYDMYREELRLVGVGHTPMAGAVLRDIPSAADTEFMEGLSWSELLARSNSAAAEAALLNAEVTFRANNFRKQSSRDSRTFQATSDEMKQKLADLTEALEKEAANSKRRETDMRLGCDAELLKLKNELRILEVRLEASREETHAVKEELALAQLDAESARAELTNGAEVFKETFLKSDEFEDIIGDKALGFLYVGFDGCAAQFKEAGYPPEGDIFRFS